MSEAKTLALLPWPDSVVFWLTMTKEYGPKLTCFDSKRAGCRMAYPESMGVDLNMFWRVSTLNRDSDDPGKSKRPQSCT